MPKEALPEFTYFRDPVGVGVFVASDLVCRCCSQARGYIYNGPVFADEDLDDLLCPWCIADGAAAKRFNATFVDEDGVGGYVSSWESVPQHVKDELVYRTPCFTGWQSNYWWTHLGDAGVFIDYAGKDELLEYGPELIQQLKAD